MRVILSTPVLLGALLVSRFASGSPVAAWRRGAFELLTCELQLQEIRAVTQLDEVRSLIRPALAGELIAQLRGMAVCAQALPPVSRSGDPFNNYLLALADALQADILVTDDKKDVLALQTFGNCRITTSTDFINELQAPR